MTAHLATPRARRYRGVDDEERRAERRRRLVEAACDVFGGEGYQAATVRGICVRAGLTERYFYESFAGREELLAAVYGWIVNGLREELAAAIAAPPPEERGRAALEAYFARIEANPALGRVLLLEILGISPAIDRLYQGALDELARVLAAAFAGNTAPAPAPAGLGALGMAGAVVTIAVHWIMTGYRLPREEIVAHCADLLAAFPRAALP